MSFGSHSRPPEGGHHIEDLAALEGHAGERVAFIDPDSEAEQTGILRIAPADGASIVPDLDESRVIALPTDEEVAVRRVRLWSVPR